MWTLRMNSKKRLVHPQLGVLDLQCQVLHDVTHLHTLLVFTAEVGSVSHTKLTACVPNRTRIHGKRWCPMTVDNCTLVSSVEPGAG